MKQYDFSFYVVVLVDLLGQSEKLEKFSTLPKSKEGKEAEHFIEMVKQTFEDVKKFRELILELRDVLSRKIKIPDAIKSRLNTSQLKLAEKYTMPIVEVQFFSDLAMLKINLLEREDHSPLISINSLFSQLAILFLSQLSIGIPLRGAIDVGICAELDKNDLYGQAVSRAYKLESKVADYPRIIVGQDFIDYLNSFEDIEVSKEEIKIIDFWVNYIKNCLIKDTDGNFILSYLSPVFIDSYSYSIDSFKESIKDASKFIFNEIKKYEKLGDKKLQDRYIGLMNYFKNQNCWIKP